MSARAREVLLLLLSFFSGIFLSNFFTFATGRFIDQHSHKDLALAYIGSGFVGLLISSVYRLALARMQERNLYRYTLAAVIVIVYIILGVGTLSSEANFGALLTWVGFLFLSSIYSLVELQFWGIAIRLFNIREGKRVFGRIAIGDVSAALLGYLSIFIFNISIQTIPIIAILASIGMLTVQHILLRTFQEEPKSETKPEQPTISVRSLWKSSWIVRLFVIACISVGIQYIIDFEFLENLEKRQPMSLFSHMGSIGAISFVFASIKGLELLLKLSYARLIRSLRMKGVLSLFPWTLFILFSGGILTFYVTELPFQLGLPFAFLIAKGLERCTKPSLEVPTMRLLYMTEPARSQSLIQLFINGYAKQSAIIVSGILLFLMADMHDRSMVFVFVIILASMVWLLLIRKATADYPHQLIRFLTGERKILPGLTINHQKEKRPTLSTSVQNGYSRMDKASRIRLIKESGDGQDVEFLIEVLRDEKYDKEILFEALRSLKKAQYSFQTCHSDHIYRLIDRLTENIVWIQQVHASISYRGNAKALLIALEERARQSLEYLLLIAGFFRPSFNLNQIKKHLDLFEDTQEEAFALELIDQVFDTVEEAPLKQSLLILLDQNQSKVKMLKGRKELLYTLKQVYYADPFYINRVIRFLAFEVLVEGYSTQFREGILGSIQHADLQIRDLAVKTVCSAKHD